MAVDAPSPLHYGTPAARRVIAATVLGSGVAFLDGTVVNVALPTISRDLNASITALQWILDSYLVTLSALLLLGGSLGDRYGRRRVFVAGLVAFTAASVLCGLAPTPGFLIAARALQGIGGALLVPGSLAIIGATFAPDDRARAIGAWSGLAGVATAIGPFVGGWLIDAGNWRMIFLINLPIAAVAGVIAVRHVPETVAPQRRPLDVGGAGLATLAVALLAYAAIEHQQRASGVVAVAGAAALLAFLAVERTSTHPMVPLGVFRSGQFTGANLTTLAVYAGLGGGLFLVVLRLQESLGYSALEAGASLVPFTVLMLALSSSAGRIAQRTGARLPMTVGPLVAAVGLLLFAAIGPGDGYVPDVLLAVVVFGVGMAITVAPLTAAVLGSVDDDFVGVASGINNAVARLAGLLAVAVLPAVAGIDASRSIASSLDAGYAGALRMAAVLCALGGGVAAATIRRTAEARPVPHPAPQHSCHDGALVTAGPARRP